MENNLELYNKVREVPEDAQKPIQGGRLRGMTDINPMWRIKTLTEQFGPCGIGWGYTIDRQWIEDGADGEKAAFCNISLWVRIDGEKTEPIPGTGGSMFIAKESKGLYISDEAFKMALTDAISVSCKSLGIGADVYWKDKTKYDSKYEPATISDKNKKLINKMITSAAKANGRKNEDVIAVVEKNIKKKMDSVTDADVNFVLDILEMLTASAGEKTA